MRYILSIVLFTINLYSSCATMPDNNTMNGYTYQGMVSDEFSCRSMYNDSGDGLGYLYANPNLEPTCAGFCYFNTAGNDGGNNNGGDTGGTGNVSDLIPFLDEVEEKNENINNSIIDLNSNLNSQFTNLNSNQDNLNTTMSNLDGTLQNLNTSIQELKDSNNSGGDGSTPPDYSGVTDGFNIDPNIDEELNAFQSDIETSISSSFNTYSNVFGLGGYGSAPMPIKFNLLGKTYTVFDISYISSYIDQIRNVFIITGYLFGIFLVFRGD